jgi:ketosteroid isomerase-like protein
MNSIKLRCGLCVIAGLCILGSAGGFVWSRAEGFSKSSYPTSPWEEKAVISKVVTDSICWALTKDRALAESTLAHDEDLFYFWTNSTFTVNGWQQHLRYFDTWMDPRFKAIRTEVRDLRIHLSRSGDVAWYAATLDDVVEFDGKRGGAEDIRWTGVLEKRDGKWVVVQMHASLATDQV